MIANAVDPAPYQKAAGEHRSEWSTWIDVAIVPERVLLDDGEPLAVVLSVDMESLDTESFRVGADRQMNVAVRRGPTLLATRAVTPGTDEVRIVFPWQPDFRGLLVLYDYYSPEDRVTVVPSVFRVK